MEGRIRQKLLEMDLVEAVVGLGPNLFYGTGLAACILVFRTRKAPERKGRVLLADSSGLFRRGRNQNTLEPEHAQQIFGWYQAFEDVPGAVRVVGLDEIERNGWNLNISRYVEPLQEETVLSVDEALANLRHALADAYAAEDRLRALLAANGLLPASVPAERAAGELLTTEV